MELHATGDQPEPPAEKQRPEPPAVTAELQIAVASITQEVCHREEAAPGSCPEVNCAHIENEVLDMDPTIEMSSNRLICKYRFFPDDDLFRMTDGREAGGVDVGAAEDPVTELLCVEHSLYPPDLTFTDQSGSETLPGVGEEADMTSAESQDANAVKKPFKCNQCEKSYYRKAHLQHHQRMHTGEKPYHCVNCDKRFCLRRSLEAHQRRCVGRHSYSCPTCGDVFQSFSNLHQHRRIHDTEKSAE